VPCARPQPPALLAVAQTGALVKCVK